MVYSLGLTLGLGLVLKFHHRKAFHSHHDDELLKTYSVGYTVSRSKID